MVMSHEEIWGSYSNADNKPSQISMLAKLNSCDESVITEIINEYETKSLVSNGDKKDIVTNTRKEEINTVKQSAKQNGKRRKFDTKKIIECIKAGKDHNETCKIMGYAVNDIPFYQAYWRSKKQLLQAEKPNEDSIKESSIKLDNKDEDSKKSISDIWRDSKARAVSNDVEGDGCVSTSSAYIPVTHSVAVKDTTSVRATAKVNIKERVDVKDTTPVMTAKTNVNENTKDVTYVVVTDKANVNENTSDTKDVISGTDNVNENTSNAKEKPNVLSSSVIKNKNAEKLFNNDKHVLEDKINQEERIEGSNKGQDNSTSDVEAKLRGSVASQSLSNNDLISADSLLAMYKNKISQIDTYIDTLKSELSVLYNLKRDYEYIVGNIITGGR